MEAVAYARDHRVLSLSFDPTGPRLATGAAGGDASIWAIPTGARLRHLHDIGEPVDRIAFSPNGELVATANRSGEDQVWHARSGSLQSHGNYLRSRIFSLEFDSTSTLVLSAGESGTAVVSDAAQGMPVAVLDGPQAVIRVAHFDPSARRVVGASWDGTARVWDAASPYRRWNSPPIGDECDTVESLEPDHRFIALSCRNHGTHVWDTARDELLAELPGVTTVEGDYYSAFPAVSAAGDRAAIARGNVVMIYALPGGRLLRMTTHSAAVNAVAFSATDHDLVSGGIDGSLLITHDDRDTIALPASPDGIDAVCFLPGGRVVATDVMRRLRVYDPDRNVVLAQVDMPTRVRSLRPSSDGRHLLTIPVRAKPTPPVLWDVEHYRMIGELRGHQGRVFSARFVSGDHQILTAGNDGTARVWDGVTGALRQTYRGSSRFLFDAAIDPSGSLVVAGDNDGQLRFWDAASGRALWTLQAHKSYLIGIHFEGDSIVTRGFAGEVSRWTLPPSEPAIQASQAAK
jgi:WD40 repeat protein